MANAFVQPGSMRDIIQNATGKRWFQDGLYFVGTHNNDDEELDIAHTLESEDTKYIATFDPLMVEAMCNVIDCASELVKTVISSEDTIDLQGAFEDLERIKQEKGLP